MLSFQQREDDVDYHMMLIPSSYSKIKACNVVMMKMLMMTRLMVMRAGEAVGR